MLLQPHDAKEEVEVEVPTAPTPPSLITAPSPPPQDPIPTPPQAQHATPHDTPLQEQPAVTSDSSISLLNTLMETCATSSQKVVELEKDKNTQALDILKLKKRVKKLVKKKSRFSGLKRLRKVGGKIEAIDVDVDITLVDVETQEEVADMDVELQGRITQEDVSAATKDVNAAEPTVFDDEEVTMAMAQTLITMKAKKAKLLDEQIAKRLHDEEVEQAAARENEEKDDLERAQVLQQGMTYDKVRPTFKREYKKVQTLFKPDKDVEEPQKKRVAEETLLHEKKDYPLSNGVMTLMQSAKLQIEEDSEMAKDLVMKIFMEANKPKSKTGVDVVQDLKENAPKRLLLLVKVLMLLTSSKNRSKLLESQVSDKTCLGYDSQAFDRQVLVYEELHSYESDDSVPKSPVNDSNFNKKVTTVMVNKVNVVQGVKGNAEKVSANWTLKNLMEDMLHLERILKVAGAVNTACYVQNSVLVTKPHNKTPCELLLGRSPSIGFMRPFGCPVTILNILDPLGMFDGKANEGFLVGYFVNSKAFRVFNCRTSIVQETLHTNFLENKPNVVGTGPKWLFYIDTLTRSMNYQPVVAGNQPNNHAGIKENLDAGNENDVYVSPGRSDKIDSKKHDEKAKIGDKGNSPVDAPVTAARLNPSNSTNSFNVASPFNTTASPNFRISRQSSFVDPSNYPDDPDMPALEDIVYSDDEEDVGAEAGFSNLETNISVSFIPTTRVYKDHLVTQIIGDLTSAPQTRSIKRMVKEQGGLNQINDEDFHTSKKVHQVLKDLSWMEAMQKELLQFKMQKVWVLVDLPKGKRAIGSKCMNKKDERGIMIRNKARLVAQGHTQEEGIDYDEVFALVARTDDIRLFLAYASFMGFMVYQMDVKSAFLYETIEEEVYICQPLGFEDLDYLGKVYKVVKALYGLHHAPRAWYETSANYLLKYGFQRGKIDQTLFIKKQKGDILLVQVYMDDIIFGSINKELLKQKDYGICISQDKYVAKIFRKFGFTNVKSASSPIETKKPLPKDPDGEDVDVHINSDYAGASLDRKSTIGGCQFLGCKLISWQCKKKIDVATSLIGAEYVAVANCCAQVLWVQKDVIRQDLHLDYAIGVECLPNEEIFAKLTRMRYEKPPPKLTFYKAFFSGQWKFLIHTLVQYVSAKRTPWNEFSCFMASAVICLATDPIPTPPQAQPATPHDTPSQEQPTVTSYSFISLLNTLMETCATSSQKVAELEPDKNTQALEILKLKKRVKKLEKKKKSRFSGLKRLRKVGGKIEAIDVDVDITLVDVKTQEEDVNAAEPTVFDDEEVTMTMAQTLIKMKVEKAKLLDEHIAKRLHDEEVEQAVAREREEKDDLERAQYDDKEENIDWNDIAEQVQEKHLYNIRKYQNLKRKPVSIAQARKNIIIYLKNMVGYKLEHFRGMTYDKVRPIFKREYKKVQTLFKPNKDVEEPQKKRVAEETLLQESFKKLKAVKVLGSESTQETPTNDPKEMSEEDV
nr:hypothetical protein [Tanacetum cinerariifolium]